VDSREGTIALPIASESLVISAVLLLNFAFIAKTFQGRTLNWNGVVKILVRRKISIILRIQVLRDVNAVSLGE
jgi:hypothetical protein